MNNNGANESGYFEAGTQVTKKSSYYVIFIGIAIFIIVIVFIIGYSNNSIDSSSISNTENVSNLRFTNSKGISFSYTGPVTNVRPNGKGTGYYDNGVYTGPYIEGLRSGSNCTYQTSDGKNIFNGSFINDEYDYVTLKMNTGEYYEGSFSSGQPYTGNWYNSNGSFNSSVSKGK